MVRLLKRQPGIGDGSTCSQEASWIHIAFEIRTLALRSTPMPDVAKQHDFLDNRGGPASPALRSPFAPLPSRLRTGGSFAIWITARDIAAHDPLTNLSRRILLHARFVIRAIA
ncbi:hypothetical protein XAUB_24730 [Xanthomonas citri pv. aurantifolii str. ICPB 11122]|nr:hypothetical protein XAUB_24730 [Xanthomonas citri pv. aurantifolii str. ICPB 11122]